MLPYAIFSRKRYGILQIAGWKKLNGVSLEKYVAKSLMNTLNFKNYI
jgi:hypothetical protein